jgi:hypothetical protein
MNKEKDFFKTCFDTVARLEVKNESQAIAKEVVLDEIENLQQELADYKQRNEKAIEYINGFSLDFYDYECEQLIVGKYIINDLLEILDKKDKE